MALSDVISPRPRGRPPKPRRSAIADALDRPLPAEIGQLRRELEEAFAAYQRARSAMTAASSEDTAHRLAAAERTLRKLEVSRDIAGPLGNDAPTAEEFEAAERELSAARVAHEGKEDRRMLYEEALDERRAALDGVHRRFSKALETWKVPVREAINAELSDAAQRAGEALATLKAIDPWRPKQPTPWFPNILNLGSSVHTGPDSVELPDLVAPAIDDWQRVQSALIRA